jgi:DNA polymerase-3 subunit epsilon
MTAMALVFIIILALIAYFYFFRSKPKKIDLSILPEQFVVVDFETTGLDADKHEIIEIGAVRVNRDSNMHKTFSALIKPKNKVPKKIAEMTGITNEMLE